MSNTKKALTALFCILITAGIVFSVIYMKSDENKDSAVSKVKDSKVDASKVKDGDYTGSAQGYGGPIDVKVTIKDGKIVSIKVLSHNETPSYYDMSAQKVIDSIIAKNSVDVDSVSGATITSNAIKSAVSQALAKAGVKSDVKTAAASSNTKARTQTRIASRSGALNLVSGTILDGTYEGNGTGYNGNIKVRISIRGGEIVDIRILSHREDEPFFSDARSVIQKLYGKPGKRVDAVSGATYSSNGIIEAVNNAIRKAVSNTTANNSNVTPIKPPVKPDTPKPKPPVITEDDIKKPTDDKDIDDKLRAYYNGDPFKDGVYSGIGYGYKATAGGIKSTITVKNGEIAEIEVGKTRADYADDQTPFREYAMNVVPFLKDKNGRWNAAKVAMYKDYYKQIREAAKPYEKSVELIGAKHSEKLKNYDSIRGTEAKVTAISESVKGYVADKYNAKPLMDSMTGATISGAGINEGIREAAAKAANDYKNNSSVKSLSVVSPIINKEKVVEVNRGDNIDFSDLSVKLVGKDNSEKIVPFAEFAANELKIVERDSNKEISNGDAYSKFTTGNVINAKIVHEKSLSYDSIIIRVGKYSKDFITGIEYSKDGINWFKVENVKMGLTDDRNISHEGQTINAPKNYQYESIRVRTVSKSGKRYEYKTDMLAGAAAISRYALLQPSDNPNTPEYLYVSFTFSGTEADKQKVDNGGQPDPGTKPEEPAPTGEEVKVNGSVIGISLDDGIQQDWIDKKDIIPVTVTLYDKDATIIKSIEGLPKGLEFNGTTITGKPNFSDWGSEYYKSFTLRIKAQKGDKILVREKAYSVLRDLDRDGIPDADEYSESKPVFTPVYVNQGTAIEVDGKAPTLEDYKAKIANLPKDGSVTVKLAEEPNLTELGRKRVNLEFTVNGLAEKGKGFVFINVVSPVTKKELTEVAVNGSVIGVSLDDSVQQDWLTGREIRPVTVTLSDSEAVMVKEIDNLPEGLIFDGKTITGKPAIKAEEWKSNEYYKSFKLKFKAEKGDKLLVREMTWSVLRDLDRDGIPDADEYSENKPVFTPQFVNRIPIEVNGAPLTLDDYKAKISNLPDDGSVELKVVKEPDLTSASVGKIQMVSLEFTVKGLEGKGTGQLGVKVVTPVENKVQEIPVSGSVIGVSLDDSIQQDWITGREIRPVTVTLSDSEAVMVNEVENLPEGLTFDGSKITGKPTVKVSDWQSNEYYKSFKLKFKARKGDKLLVREMSWSVLRDLDRDGIPDADEYSESTPSFTAQFKDRTPITANKNGQQPALEAYKAKISNLPDDNSVTVAIKEAPDLSSTGMKRVTLEFTVNGNKSTGIIMVNVVE